MRNSTCSPTGNSSCPCVMWPSRRSWRTSRERTSSVVLLSLYGYLPDPHPPTVFAPFFLREALRFPGGRCGLFSLFTEINGQIEGPLRRGFAQDLERAPKGLRLTGAVFRRDDEGTE